MNFDPTDFDRVLDLSQREYEVFRWLGDGYSVMEMAHWPGKRVTKKTIITYITRTREKLMLRDVRQTTVLAARYNASGMKRVPIPTVLRQYAFLMEIKPCLPFLPMVANDHEKNHVHALGSNGRVPDEHADAVGTNHQR